MGLDIILKVTKLSTTTNGKSDVNKMTNVNEVNSTGASAEFAYWRKFNALHGYFVRYYNVENCEELILTKEMVADLKERVINITSSEFSEDAERIAEKNLPIMVGPFFGSYDYDDFYYRNIYQLRDILTSLEVLIESNDLRFAYIASF